MHKYYTLKNTISRHFNDYNKQHFKVENKIMHSKKRTSFKEENKIMHYPGTAKAQEHGVI